MIIKTDITNTKRVLIAKAGTKVTFVSSHGNVIIVKPEKGNAFAVLVDEVIGYEET